MPFELPPLPYAPNALEPYTSAKTIALHYGKHHRAYVTKLNALIAGTSFETMSLEAVIRATQDMSDAQAIFNNAAQHWNHSKFWNSMRPAGPRKMPAALERRLIAQFGSIDAFKSEFVAQGLSQFGSGWVWLVEKDGSLHVQRTPNAMTPLVGGGTPLLVCDVWEHAYYVDYENRRADFLKAFVDHLANWDAIGQ